VLPTQMIDGRNGLDEDKLAELGEALRGGALVVFPTETVYGIGGNGLSGAAVANIFRAKGRPADNPVILHIAELAMLWTVAGEVPELAWRLGERFWPGPLTLVVPKGAEVPDEVTAGLATVAVRVPDHPVARALIAAAGVPLAAPSANLSGRPSPTDAAHAAMDLGAKVDYIVDGGPCRVGVESTVVDLTVCPPVILRHGGVTLEQLREFGVEALSGQAEAELALKSPGLRHRHYAPQGKAWLYCQTGANLLASLRCRVGECQQTGQQVMLVASAEACAALADALPGEAIINLGSRENAAAIAANLFSALRLCDERRADIILIEGFSEVGLGKAIGDRLARACEGRVVR